MRYQEFGSRNQQTLVLLHGGGLSWWNYRASAEALQEHYRVILPILDGHSGSDAPFTSQARCAERLLSFLDAACDGHVTAICGLSLGAQVALEVLARRPEICRCALLESPQVIPDPVTRALVGPSFAMSYGLIQKRWFARLQGAYLRIPEDLFEDYYRDTCAISKEDLIAFTQASCSFRPPAGLSQGKARVQILWGSRELNAIRRSAALLQQQIPGSTAQCLPGLSHGELSLKYPGEYARLLEALIRDNPMDDPAGRA